MSLAFNEISIVNIKMQHENEYSNILLVFQDCGLYGELLNHGLNL